MCLLEIKGNFGGKMKINIINVPVMYGSDKNGTEYAPRKLKEAGGLDFAKKYGHEIVSTRDVYIPISSYYHRFDKNHRIKYLEEVVKINEELAEKLEKTVKEDEVTMMIGGDHVLGLGSIAGVSKFAKKLAVFWIDAHADINTEKTSPSANAHGMPLAAAIGLGAKELTDINKNKLNPENVYIIGARDLDPGEVEICRDKKVNLYEMGKCRTEGISKILDEALEKVEKDKIDTIHLSFDIDALDRLLVPGTGTPVSNGFALEEGIEVIRRIMGTKKVRTIDLVEFNPRIDKDNLALKSTLSLLEAMFKYM